MALSRYLLYVSGENGPNHRPECSILSSWTNKDLDFFSDNVILEQIAIYPLRLLGLSETNPELYGRIQLLMDHLKDMGKDEKKVWEVSANSTTIWVCPA